MEYLYERVAYLKGLCEGANISKDTKEGLVLHKIIEVLEDFADEIAELSDNQEDLKDMVYDIEDRAADLEDEFYLDDEQDIICPSCGEEVYIEDEILYDEDEDVYCPVCDEIILPAVNNKSSHRGYQLDNEDDYFEVEK